MYNKERQPMKLYKASIVTVIEDTPNLVVRVPQLHWGLKDIDLPVARPMIIPGVKIDKDLFLEQIQELKYVWVFFESNKVNDPIYFTTFNDYGWGDTDET